MESVFTSDPVVMKTLHTTPFVAFTGPATGPENAYPHLPPASLLEEDPKTYWRTYREDGGSSWQKYRPNPYHEWLKEQDAPVVTSAVDGCHRLAGSFSVYELRGNRAFHQCSHCTAIYKAVDFLREWVPTCSLDDHPLMPLVFPPGTAIRLSEAKEAFKGKSILLLSGFPYLQEDEDRLLRQMLRVHHRLQVWAVGPTPAPEGVQVQRRVEASYEDLPQALTATLA